jgi:hypothetical protein
MARLAVVLVLALALAGCGSDNESAADESGGTPTATTADCPPLADAGLTPRMSPAVQNRETMFLTGVSPETDECVDRVVFTFKEQAPGPGFEVSYKPESAAKIEDGSGNPVEIEGSAFLVVRIAPAMTAEISGEEVKPTYTGPRRITPEGFSFIREVVKTGDFEGIVTWVIGLDQKQPFTTSATDSHLVVEIGP